MRGVLQKEALRVWLGIFPLAAALCTFATWLHYYWTGTLNLNEWPPVPSIVVPRLLATAGIVVLGACCVAVYLNATQENLHRVLRSALVAHLILLLALPLFSTDLFSYLAYGELMARGLSPKLFAPDALTGSPLLVVARWQHTHSVYGPVADQLMAVAGYVGHWTQSPVWIAGITYKALVGLFDITSLVLLYKLVRRSERPEYAKGFVIFALSPGLAWEVVAQAHNDGLVVVAAVVYLWAMERRREPLGILALVFGALTKFIPGITLALHLWAVVRQDFKRAVLLGVLALVAVLVCCAPTWYPGAPLTNWLPQLAHDPTLHDGTSLYTVLWKVLERLGGGEHAHQLSYRVFGWAGRLVVLVVLASLLRRLKTTRDVPAASLFLLVALLSTSAVIAPWYLPWLLPFAAVQSDRRWQLVVLAITVGCAPALGIPGIWLLLLPPAQILGLVALARWMKTKAPLGLPEAPETSLT